MKERQFSGADRRLMAYVRQQAMTGTRIVRLPAYLLEGTTENGLAEARAFAKIGGFTFEIETFLE